MTPLLERDRAVLEDAGVDQDAEVLGACSLDELDVLVDDFVLDRGGGEWISGQMMTSSSSASGRDASTTSVQIGCGTRSTETTPIFGRTNRNPSRFARRRSRCSAGALFDGHVAPVGAAGVQAAVDPRAVVGGLEAVLLEQPEPVVDPLLRGVRVIRHVPLAEDLDAGRADVGDARHRGLQIEHRP